MKRVIKSSSIAQDEANKHAKVILSKMKALFDALENTPSGFLDANDLGDLYMQLSEDIPALDFSVNSGNVEYNKDNYGRITRDPDMWED